MLSESGSVYCCQPTAACSGIGSNPEVPGWRGVEHSWAVLVRDASVLLDVFRPFGLSSHPAKLARVAHSLKLISESAPPAHSILVSSKIPCSPSSPLHNRPASAIRPTFANPASSCRIDGSRILVPYPPVPTSDKPLRSSCGHRFHSTHCDAHAWSLLNWEANALIYRYFFRFCNASLPEWINGFG